MHLEVRGLQSRQAFLRVLADSLDSFHWSDTRHTPSKPLSATCRFASPDESAPILLGVDRSGCDGRCPATRWSRVDVDRLSADSGKPGCSLPDRCAFACEFLAIDVQRPSRRAMQSGF